VIDGIPQIPPQVESEAVAVLASLATNLASRPTDRERALGLYLQIIAAGSAAFEAWRSTHGDCGNGDDCWSAAAPAVEPARAESRHALVRLAATTSDANAYALALYSCAAETAVSDCALLSHSQWARIEPDNAVPWLYLAGEAAQRRDRGSLEAAMNRASKSRYSDPHQDEISGFLASDALGEQSPPVQIQLAVALIGIEAAIASPYVQVLPQYCSAAAQADPNRVQTCSDLAAVLIEHGRTELEVSIGGKVAESVGGTDPRLSALRDEADAMRWQWGQMLKSLQDRIQNNDWLSCDSLQGLRRKTAAELQFGKAGYLRRELAASGITTTQAAQRWRAERQALLRQGEDRKPTE
jgi:hypothetical protein